MGYKTEFNWVVKLTPDTDININNLEQDKEYLFKKEGQRVYPLNIPLDMADHNWSLLAKVVVFECHNSNNSTQIRFKILKLYNENERLFLNNYWAETIDYMKKRR